MCFSPGRPTPFLPPLPAGVPEALWQRGWLFYTFIGAGGCRLMCAWDTTETDVDAFLADVTALLSPKI